MLEIIAESLSDAIAAEAGGADRIELVSALSEGGLTPSHGLISEVLSALTIPVHVMVRPHSRSFCYDSNDIAVMCADIRSIKGLKANGIVVGALTPYNKVDHSAMSFLLQEADGLSVTFHRAFDRIADREEALREIARYPQIRHILTSGGQNSVLDSVDEIIRLRNLAEQHGLTILAGSGLTIPSLESFVHASGVSEVHLGTGVRAVHEGLDVVDTGKVALARSRLYDALQKKL
ncbi:copper homeostasis protein CutC [Paenibacillus sp. sptzw28]|uniref:copper homeostasis protein CutC n=1 Tax=Paenibacillus sp. sptzw28 TaxID=715179 RepID=UPI001C6E0045|nr:copper homeostasis protein CutC [Paenibacillus sp. sptzw28]QYR22959.1 copper homeostasis protein CutC [Paenibacillus sp. sptzw28]